jgi:hypothetical protein
VIRIIAICMFAATALITTQAALAAGPIDLDVPGVLDALHLTNPAHYEKVVKILDSVRNQPEAAVARWLHVGFDARDVSYAPIVLTSHPAKRRLSFALDDTRYVAVIVLTSLRGEIVPLK